MSATAITELTKAEVLERVKGLDKDRRNATVCALVGHSRIQDHCFGYYSCARCDATVGDTLASCYDASKVLVRGHDCEVCRDIAKTLTWKDKLFCSLKRGE